MPLQFPEYMSSYTHPSIPSDYDMDDAFSSTNVPKIYEYTRLSIPSDYDVKGAFSSTNAPNYTPTLPDYSRDFFPPEDISPPKDTKTLVESPIPVSPYLSVGSSSPIRSTTAPPDYPFDESILAELDNSLWIIPRLLGSKPVPEEPDESDTCYNVHLWK
ncbi:hypothetical protein Tco_0651089 [Tanacetum coccineum]